MELSNLTPPAGCVSPARAAGGHRPVLPQDGRDDRIRGQLGYHPARTRPTAIHARVADDACGAANDPRSSSGSSWAKPPAIGKAQRRRERLAGKRRFPSLRKWSNRLDDRTMSRGGGDCSWAGPGMVCPVGLNAAAACGRDAGEDIGVQGVALPRQPGRADRGGRGPRSRDLSAQGGATGRPAGEVARRPAEIANRTGLGQGAVARQACAKPDRPGGGADLAATIVVRVQEALNLRFHPRHSRAYTVGHAAAFEAVAPPRQLLGDSTIPACLVWGV